MPEYDIKDYSLSVEEAYDDPAVRRELEDNAPHTFAAARLAERAGLEVRAEVTSFGPGEDPWARWEVNVPKAAAKRIAAAAWVDSEGNLDYTLTPSVDGTHWRLTSWARDGAPFGHRELPEVEDAFDYGPMASGERLDNLAQIVLRDGTVLVREGFAGLPINPSPTAGNPSFIQLPVPQGPRRPPVPWKRERRGLYRAQFGDTSAWIEFMPADHNRPRGWVLWRDSPRWGVQAGESFPTLKEAKLYAEDWLRRDDPRFNPAQDEALTFDPKRINRALRPSGWQVTELTLNQTTGFARLRVERRDYESGTGRLVTLLRSGHGNRVVMVRDVTALRPGMYRSEWEVVDTLGQTRFPGMKSALRSLADYLADNSQISMRAARDAFRPLAASVDNPSAREVRKALRKAGCEEIRQKGSHVQVQCPPEGRQTTVPVHGGRDLKRGTVRSIERSVGIDVDGDGRPTSRERKLARRLSNP